MGDPCDKLRPSIVFAKELFGNRDVIGVEIGVDEGEHANRILSDWKNVKKLYLVDVIDNIHDRFKVEGDRVEFFHESSIEGAKRFPDNYFDFVYIDAGHSYESVMEDLNAWYPKLKVGGIICGHDMNDNEIGTKIGVGGASSEFFKLHDLKLEQGHVDFWGIKK